MITNTIKLLQADKWHNVSQEVEIAKGRYEYTNTWKGCLRQIIRILKFRNDGKEI